MHIHYDNYEYKNIVNDILCNREFKKLEDCKHHGIKRIEHSRRVSFISYKLCKKLGLDYVSAARGGLLHDFFMNKYIKKQETNSYLSNILSKLILNISLSALFLDTITPL